ncbi:MAG: hypothetical protein ABI579_06500, partial [Candidatus Sumerlaeota bacterium]
PLLGQHTAGVYYWFLAGFGALLPRLQLVENDRAAEAAALLEQEEDEEYYEDEYTPLPVGRV